MMTMTAAMALGEALNVLDLPPAPRASLADQMAVEAIETLAAVEALIEVADQR